VEPARDRQPGRHGAAEPQRRRAYDYLESSLLHTEQAGLPLTEISREASSLMSVVTDLAVARSLAGHSEEAIAGLEATRGLGARSGRPGDRLRR
jgi:hypothetical protein